MQVIADRNAVENVLAQANLAFEVSDADKFASAFAVDAVYELKELYGTAIHASNSSMARTQSTGPSGWW
jgi:hypothetical protein